MWYASSMPAELSESMMEAADAAVIFAQQVRRMHRRRTGRSSTQRKTDIDLAIFRLKEAMGPLRSEIGRFAYGPQTTLAERNRQAIRDASDKLQRERRKLWKMQTTEQRESAKS
jgi:hypothetical protein